MKNLKKHSLKNLSSKYKVSMDEIETLKGGLAPQLIFNGVLLSIDSSSGSSHSTHDLEAAMAAAKADFLASLASSNNNFQLAIDILNARHSMVQATVQNMLL